MAPLPDTQARADVVRCGFVPPDDVPFPGRKKHWPNCICVKCGATAVVTYRNLVVLGMNPCKTCSYRERGLARRTPEKEARDILLVHRMNPPETPYPGSMVPWEGASCMDCGSAVAPRVAQLARGNAGCRDCANRANGERRRKSQAEAFAIARHFEVEPLEEYPGRHARWLCRCPCGGDMQTTLGSITRAAGALRCKACLGRQARERCITPEAEAVQVMEDAGFHPLVPYINMMAPWSSVCKTCGQVSTPTLANVKHGGTRCGVCSHRKTDNTLPARLYMVINKDLFAVKVGITHCTSNIRLRQYKKHGWQVISLKHFATGAEAYAAEQQILRNWREQGIPEGVTGAAMPMGGHTETAPLNALPEWRLLTDAS